MGFLSDMFKGSGGSIVSGALGAVTGLLGTNSRNDNAWALANMNAQAQRDFAQNSIRWKVEDAKRAGVHPLAALGVAPASFSPVSASFGDYSGVADMLSDMGQNIDRAALVAKDDEARRQAQGNKDVIDALTVRNMELQNDLLQAQIDSMRATSRTALPPGAPPTDGKKISPLGSLPTAPEKEGYIGDPEVQFNPTAQDPNVFVMNPGSDVTSLWEDKDIAGLIPLDLWPIIKANGIDYLSRLRGKIVNGMVYDNSRGGWVSVNGPYGKSALADRLGIGNFLGHIGKGVSKIINPRGKKEFSPSDYARGFYTY